MPAIWLTGLSGAGKTTLARGLCARLESAGVANTLLLDGDEIRRRLPKAYGHGLTDRSEVLRLIVPMAKAAIEDGKLPVIATISHQVWMRDLARSELNPMLEVFADCPPNVCAARDPKGLYLRARAGEFPCFIGVTHAYERDNSSVPDVVLRTDLLSQEAALDRLFAASLDHLGLA